MLDTVLDVENLTVEYRRRRAAHLAVDDVSFSVAAGETVAVVGESGSGKTTIGRAILGLVQPTRGHVRLAGHEFGNRGTAARRARARDLTAVFQDPFGSMNPSLPVGTIVGEPLRAQGSSRSEVEARVGELLRRVGLPADSARRYPAHFSGGQRQRIAIARALSVSPRLVVCDEPTSALDVSTQRQVLDLLAELRRDGDLSYLFITHDLAVVRDFADRVLVLQKGRLVEDGTAEQVCERPRDPYTRALVAAAPVPDPVLQRRRREQRLAARDAAPVPIP